MSRITPFLVVVCFSLLFLCFVALAADQQKVSVPPTKIIRLDPRFDQLVPANAVVEVVADGFAWVEGPVWNHKKSALLFSDIPNNAVMQWKEGNGISQFLKPSGYSGSAPFTGREPGSNGLTFDSQGRLVLCEHGDRRIARLETDGRRTTLVDRYQGKRLNSPNDVVFTSNGDLYFTDPPFGLPQSFDDPQKELDFQGVYRLSAKGELSVLLKDVKAPNGIAFSPDEKIAYISNADKEDAMWMAYSVKEDGTFADGRVLFNATSWAKSKPGVPDGMKIDKNGNLFTAGPGGIHVIAPDGTQLGSFETGVATGNCAWGDDGSSLYIAANNAILRVKLTTKGAGFSCRAIIPCESVEDIG